MERLDIINKPELINNADRSVCQLNNKSTDECFPRREVSIPFCTSAFGNFIPPVTVFKGKKYRQEIGDGSLVSMAGSGLNN
jgi:hypothetical protein